MKQAHIVTAAAAAGLAGLTLYTLGGSDTPPETATATEATISAQAVAPVGTGLADDDALAQIDRLAAELAIRDDRITALTEEITALETELATFADAPEPDLDTDAEALLAERDAAIAELETVLAERDATIAALQADLADRDAQMAEIEAGLTETKLAATETAIPEELLAGDAAKIAPQAGEAVAAPTALASPGTRTLPARAEPDVAADTARAAAGPIAEVHFESGSAELTVGGQTRALAAAAVLTALPDGMIRLTGHTDTTGSPEVNRRIAQARAEAVAEMLISAGIPADRIEIVALGQDADALPIATGDGVREPLNRCVAIWPVATTG